MTDTRLIFVSSYFAISASSVVSLTETISRVLMLHPGLDAVQQVALADSIERGGQSRFCGIDEAAPHRRSEQMR